MMKSSLVCKVMLIQLARVSCCEPTSGECSHHKISDLISCSSLLFSSPGLASQLNAKLCIVILVVEAETKGQL